MVKYGEVMDRYTYLIEPYEQFIATMKQFLDENNIPESEFILTPKSNRMN